MTPDQWLELYYQGEVFSGEFSHLKTFVQQHHLDQNLATIITVAGTNGKGETSRLIHHHLHQQGKTSALWTSPHLLSVTERFQHNTRDIAAKDLVDLFEQTKLLIKTAEKEMSYFEFLFISFLLWLQKISPEYIILEVGLGGRLDAVNTLDANICVLTSISRDHQDILGHRFELILAQKLGILRQGVKLFSALELKYLQQRTASQVANLEVVWRDLFVSHDLNKQMNFSTRNQALAKAVIADVLGAEIEEHNLKARFSLRQTLFVQGVEYWLFPTHNLDGFRKLVQYLQGTTYNQADEILISFSERPLVDLEVMLKMMCELFSPEKISLYQFSHFRAVAPEKLRELREQFNVHITDDKMFFPHATTKRVLVTGSNYFLGHFLSQLQLLR